jgi:uncharacterized membrane protein YhaH (DUF805 family)
MVRQITALLSVLRRLMTMRGRVGRGDFWVIFLATGTVSVALWVHPAAIGASAAIQVARFFLAILLLQVASPLILTSFTVRRLHDLDKPGWWTVPFLAALLVLAVIWMPAGQSVLWLIAGSAAVEPVSYVLTAISLGLVANALYFLSQKGSPDPNKHGAAPGDFDLRYLLLA